jgi:hypothetical protein
VLAVDESLIIEITTPDDLPEGFQYMFDFNTSFALSYSDARDFRYPTGPGREWKEWTFNDASNMLAGGYINASEKQSGSDDDFTICCAIGADFPMSYSVDRNVNVHVLISPVLAPGKTYRIIITFDVEKSLSYQKNQRIVQNSDSLIEKQFERYTSLGNKIPVLHSPYKTLDKFFGILPMYHEALKVPDFPGAVRAKTWTYWVWGWDGMTNNSSTAYWGDTKHVGDMLNFYRETADPEKGIAHAYRPDMKAGSISEIPAQCMYIVLLQMYYDHTLDLDLVRNNFTFAKKIYNMAAETEVNQTGLTKDRSLFPDFRDLVGETGNDISAVNNSIFYCASRSLNRLASILGDEQMQEKSKYFIDKLETNFIEYFFNQDDKYIVSSIDASTFKQRNVYHTGSFRWENNYYYDLVKPVLGNCLEFFDDHLVCMPGIRMVPKWCPAYGADANQLQAWWPVSDESYIRMINAYDRKDLVDQWIGWLSYWGNLLTCPEAVSCHIETDKPETDRWSALKGAFQAFSVRTWYQGIIHGVVGVDADAGGITFYPYSGEEMILKGLHYMDKTFDISMEGSGPFIEYIEVDGRKIIGTNKLPLEYYLNDSHVEITVRRTVSNPYPLIVKRGNGITLTDYTYKQGIIKTKLKGAGISSLEVWAAQKPKIKLNGKKMNVEYDKQSQLVTLRLDLIPENEYLLQIIP